MSIASYTSAKPTNADAVIFPRAEIGDHVASFSEALYRRSLSVILLAMALSGCAAHRIPECLPGAHASIAMRCQQPKNARWLVQRRIAALPPTSIGLALSGGGSKSAPFALGVLEGLNESGVLNHVDYISSVSGGSYAALYLYSRWYAAFMHVDHALDRRSEFFWDCLPAETLSVFTPDGVPPWSRAQPFGRCPASEETEGAYWPIEPGDYSHDPLREASHLRGYQDVLSSSFAYDNDVNSPIELRKVRLGVARLVAVNCLLLGLPNFIANSIFDWRLDMSPSKEVYDSGIVRTYARDASYLREKGEAKPNRPPGGEESPARLTFPALQSLYAAGRTAPCTSIQRAHGLCPVPYWIINATAGTSRTNLRLVDSTRFRAENNDFEFTPDGYGSGAYGWESWGAREMEPRLTVPDAVGISAAFFDSQQRQEGGPFRPTVNLLLHAANLDWGSDIPNYRQTRAQYVHRLYVHNALPWPLYLFYHEAGDQRALRIHLSDGGQTENLGVYALLRRGVRDIIVVDGGSDEKYQFGDWCDLQRQLRDEVLQLDLGQDAEGKPLWNASKCRGGNDPYHIRDNLPAMVLRGRICPAAQPLCPDASAVARLYIIKSVLNFKLSSKDGVNLEEAIKLARGHELSFTQCAPGIDTYPCEVIAYIAKYRPQQFPEDGTTTITLNSNAYIYGAYKELGRYYARHLVMAPEGATLPLTLSGGWTQ